MNLVTETHFAHGLSTVDDSQRAQTRPPRERRRPRLHEGRRAPARGGHFGRFLLLEQLGEGAMGAVYRAFDPQLEREVALKIQHERRGGARARALSEARALARVDHRSVVEVYEVGEVGPDVYVVMELLKGCSLRAWLSSAVRRPVEVLRVFNDASHGLDALHAAGLVHRDVKPDNIFVTDAGRVVMVDLGLARELPRVVDSAQLALSGVAGTPAYMAPEQHCGERATPLSDQYSLAVALWEALFGGRPHRADNLARYREKVLRGRVRAPRVSRGLSRQFMLQLRRGLSLDPNARYASAGALVETLARTMAELELERRTASVSIVVLMAVAAGFPLVVGAGLQVSGAATVMLGLAGMLVLGRLHHLYNPSRTRLVPTIIAVAHGLTPGLLFAALSADLSFQEACASWFPPLLAAGVIGTRIETDARRMWLQTVMIIVSLVGAWALWGTLSIEALPLYATGRGMTVRVLGIVMIAVLFHSQSRRLERESVFVEDVRFGRSARSFSASMSTSIGR